MEKNSSYYKGNVNQNHSETPPYTSENDLYQRLETLNVVEGVGTKGTHTQDWWGCKLLPPLCGTIKKGEFYGM